MNQVEFINWTVEGRKEVVVITKSGEVVRGLLGLLMRVICK
ncbi:hypothetical protein AB4Z30_28910 [Paenibacillus sp. 2TAF8]